MRIAAATVIILFGLSGCFSDAPESAQSGSSSGEDCPAGQALCPCTPAAACDPGLTCVLPDAICITCTAAEPGCPCDAGQCGGSLECDEQTNSCQPSGDSTTTSATTTTATSATSDVTSETSETSETSDSGSTGSTAATSDSSTSDASSSTGGPGTIALFFTPQSYTADSSLPGDARADTTDLCQAAMKLLDEELDCTQTVALIVASRSDDIASLDLPDGATVVSAASPENVLAENFATLLLNGPTVSLTASNVSFADAPGTRPGNFLTGSTSTGTLARDLNCDDWTSTPGIAATGDIETPSTWLDRDSKIGCDSATPLLCACW